MATKRKLTVTLDDEVVRALEVNGPVSPQLNDAAWSFVERAVRQQALRDLLDQLDHEDGPLADDPEEDARLARLLGGAA